MSGFDLSSPPIDARNTEASTTSTDIVVFSHTARHNTQLDPTFSLSLPGAYITVEQQYKKDGKGGTGLGFGAVVYPASVALSLLLNSPFFDTLSFTGGILELGCGPGLVGICAAARWQNADHAVVVSDGDDASVALAATNIASNAASLKSAAVPLKLLWGNREQEDEAIALAGGRIGLVVMSDVAALVYKEFFKDLASSIARFCELGAVGVMAMKWRCAKTEHVFFKVLRDSGVEKEKIPDSYLDADFTQDDGARIECYTFRAAAVA
jgi:hypothetical protein